MCTLRRLKKLVRVLDASKEKSPEMLYPGDFVRCKLDGEIYVVVVLWSNQEGEYKWNFISLETGAPLEGVRFDDWVGCLCGTQINRDAFWEDNDPDWEVINLEEVTEDD